MGSKAGLLAAQPAALGSANADAGDLSQVVVTDEDLDAARLEMLEERGYKQLEQWPGS